MPIPEALGVYIEMMARVLTDAVFAKSLGDSSALSGRGGRGDEGGKSRARFINAPRVVENLICTSRESLIGSSAWKGEFFEELCSRPFYAVQDVS